MVSCADCRLGSQSRFCQEENFFSAYYRKEKFSGRLGRCRSQARETHSGDWGTMHQKLSWQYSVCWDRLSCRQRRTRTGGALRGGQAAYGASAARAAPCVPEARMPRSSPERPRRQPQEGRREGQAGQGHQARKPRGCGRPEAPFLPKRRFGFCRGNCKGFRSRAAPLLPVCLLRHPPVRMRRPARQAAMPGSPAFSSRKAVNAAAPI